MVLTVTVGYFLVFCDSDGRLLNSFSNEYYLNYEEGFLLNLDEISYLLLTVARGIDDHMSLCNLTGVTKNFCFYAELPSDKPIFFGTPCRYHTTVINNIGMFSSNQFSVLS